MLPILKAIAQKQIADKVAHSVAPKGNAKPPLSKKILNWSLVAGVSFLGYRFVLKPMWQKYLQNQANQMVFADEPTRLASKLRTAIIGVGTDEKAVFEVAQQITDWNAVQNAYYKLTGNNLNQDLHEDLSSEQYNTFMAIVRHRLEVQHSPFKKGFIVISKKAIRLRSTPDSTLSSWSFNSNILDTVAPAKLLGFATGRYQTDSKGVLYYQVRIKYTQGIPPYHRKVYQKLNSRTLTFWVGAGAMDMFKYWGTMQEVYPQVRIYKGTKDTGLRQALK